MKAIAQTGFGPPTEVLELREVEAPVPEEGEVLVAVRAASVAKGDWLIARGEPYIARPSYGLRTPKEKVAGQVVAGVVEAVGSGAERFHPGDEVYGWCTGAFAEYVAVGEDQLSAKPGNASFEEAAALPNSGFAALQAVRDRGEVAAGQKVLVIGASGGVGSLAVQIAKAFDAEVTGVASTANVELVRSLGADHVIDYTKDGVAETGTTYDVIIDIAGNRPLSELRKALAPKGTLVIVGGTGGSATMGFGRTVRAMMLSPFVGQRLRSFISQPNRDDLDALRDLVESGHLNPVVEETYSLDEVPAAVDELGTGSSRGTRAISV